MKFHPFFWNFLAVIALSCSTGFAARGSRQSSSHPSGIGAGLMIGSITAITGKYVLPNGGAVDFGLAFMPSPWTALYGDYIFNFPGMFGSSSQFGRQSQGYFGVGGGVGFWHADHCYRYYCGTSNSSATSGVFARGFFGVEWFPGNPPFGVFAEVGPTIGLVPGFGGAIDIGTGARYFF